MNGTRGQLIGQVIDGLAFIAQALDNDSGGDSDLDPRIGAFFRDALNIILDVRLAVLEKPRKPAKGLYLGDSTAGLAFQVVGPGTASAEVSTDAASTPLIGFGHIRVLAVGGKPKRYPPDDTALARTARLGEADIWDIGDLGGLALSMEPLALRALHARVASEIARLMREGSSAKMGARALTAADTDEIQAAKRSDASLLFADDRTRGAFASPDEARAGLDFLADALAELPRAGRAFYAYLVSRSAREPATGALGLHANTALVQRLSRFPETLWGMTLLADRRFIASEDAGDGRRPSWRLSVPPGGDFETAWLAFVEDRSLNLETVLVELDFSAFGPKPA